MKMTDNMIFVTQEFPMVPLTSDYRDHPQDVLHHIEFIKTRMMG
jgi:hypothetical protein